MSEVAALLFDLMVQPQSLVTRLRQQEVPEDLSLQVLQRVLAQLVQVLQERLQQSGSGTILPEDSEVMGINSVENNSHSNSNGQGPVTPSGAEVAVSLPSRKELTLQLLALQLFAHYEWSLDRVTGGKSPVSLSLQHELMLALLRTTELQHQTIVNLRPDTVEHLLSTSSPEAYFALYLYFRWIIRSAAHLPLPVPIGDKALIYASSSDFPNGVGGGLQQLADSSAVNHLTGVALQGLEYIWHNPKSLQVPSADSIGIDLAAHKVICDSARVSLKLSNEDAKTRLLFDLAYYSFCFEKYSSCGKWLRELKQLGKMSTALPATEQRVVEGLMQALPEFDPDTKGDHATGNEALYLEVNAELESLYNNEDVANSLSNQVQRLKNSYPPPYSYVDSTTTAKVQKKALVQVSEVKAELYLACSECSGDNRNWSTFNGDPSVAFTKLYDSKSKKALIKRRLTATALFRELNKDKISRQVQDLNRAGNVVRKLTSRWQHLEDACYSAYVASLGRNNIADTAYVMLHKIHQLNALGAVAEAKALYSALEANDLERSHNSASPALRSVLMRKHAAEVAAYIGRKEPVPGELLAICRKCTAELCSVPDESVTPLLETFVVALLNQNEADFLISLEDSRRSLIQFTHALLSLAHFMRTSSSKLGLDIKKCIKTALDYLYTSMGATKTNAAASSGLKRNRDSIRHQALSAPSVVARLQQADQVSVLASLILSVFNSAIGDVALKINHSFPQLPVGNLAASSTGPMPLEMSYCLLDAILGTSSLIDPVWLRLRAEVAFSRSQHAVAVNYYLQTLMASSIYFQKVIDKELEDKTCQKMIRSFLALDLNMYAAVLSQGITDMDYSTAFKCLEERNTNTDVLYDKIWDVTLLEYATNMHSKRGEVSRKRLASENIGALDINTNNSIEIQKEVASSKKARFLRGLCLQFL